MALGSSKRFRVVVGRFRLGLMAEAMVARIGTICLDRQAGTDKADDDDYAHWPVAKKVGEDTAEHFALRSILCQRARLSKVMADDPKIGYKMINARSEDAAAKPTASKNSKRHFRLA